MTEPSTPPGDSLPEDSGTAKGTTDSLLDEGFVEEWNRTRQGSHVYDRPAIMVYTLGDGEPLKPEDRIRHGVTAIVVEVCQLAALSESDPGRLSPEILSHAGLALVSAALTVFNLGKGDTARAEECIETAEAHLAFVPTEADTRNL